MLILLAITMLPLLVVVSDSTIKEIEMPTFSTIVMLTLLVVDSP
jgi:hypothetical protein